MFPLLTDKFRSVKNMPLNIYGMGNDLSFRQLYPFSTHNNWLNKNHYSRLSLNAVFSSIRFFPVWLISYRSSLGTVEASISFNTCLN